MKTLFKNYEHKLEVAVLNDNGDFATGLSVTYEVRRSTDNSILTSGTTTEINGVYTFTYTFTENGEYRLKYITPSTYEDGFETLFVTDEFAKENTLNDHRTETENRIKNILGLTQENFRIKDHVYNTNNALESATIRIYSDSSDCDNDINPLSEYSMTASYDGVGRLINYKVTKN